MHVFDIGGTKAYDGVHQTSGIDVYVTGERTVLLDSQVCVSVTSYWWWVLPLMFSLQ